jgi:hypothetical protein
MKARPQLRQHTARTMSFVRVVVSVVLLLLSLQIIGVAEHDHAYLDTTSSCAACHFDQSLTPHLPDVTVAAAAALALLSWVVLAVRAQLFFTRPSSLIPLSQAPPAHPARA